jgi:oxygen-independent coproporphyrinogen-3 oxidase
MAAPIRPTIEGRAAAAAPLSAEMVAPAGGARWRGAYIHVPFCAHKCHYCDFYSFVDTESRQGAFVARLEAEMRAVAGRFISDPLETVFFGGGTPTLLEPQLLERMLRALRGTLPLVPDAEITVEANPETVTPEVASILASAGVRRVSMGCQSFDPRLLHALERRHRPESVPAAVGMLRDAGVPQVNLDLIFGIPGSATDDWIRDLDAALALAPDHVSAYGLVYEPNTPLHARMRRGDVTPVDEDLEARMYEHALDALAAAGFERYEISNWSRPGMACRHNLIYWTGGDWWAFGPSGSAHGSGVRWKNVPRLGDWLASGPFSPVQDVELLDADGRIGERFMLELRLAEGIAEQEVGRMLAVGERGPARRAAIARHESGGLLERRGGRIRLSRRGLLLANSVVADLV